MSQTSKEKNLPRKEFYQLIRVQERLLSRLMLVRDELRAPSTLRVLRSLKASSGGGAEQDLSEVAALVEKAIREIKFLESETRHQAMEETPAFATTEIENLPPTLSRFLAERAQSPGFSYEVREDAVRGWIIRWKEYQENGTIRGCGQFYERPYAWLED